MSHSNQIENETDESEDFEHLKISKLTNFIYIGPFEHSMSNSEEFQSLQISIIINLAREIEYIPESKYEIFHFPMDDDANASLLDQMDEAAETIHKYVSRKKKIYVHCVRGISRAPAILIYYLMQYKKFSFDRAHDLIRVIRPVVSINSNFERELRTIEDC